MNRRNDFLAFYIFWLHFFPIYVTQMVDDLCLSHPEVDGGLLCTYGGHGFLHQRQVCIHLFGLGRLLHSSDIHPPFYELYFLLRVLGNCVHEDSGVERFPSS